MKRVIFLVVGIFLMLSSIYAAVSYDNLYIVGDATSVGWNNGGAIEMEEIEDGVFAWTGELKDNTGNQRFKFLVTGKNWAPAISCRFDVNGHVVLTPGVEEDVYERVNDDGGFDNAFQVTETAIYLVQVNLNTMKIVCTKSGAELPDYTQLYLVGDATPAGWDNANPLDMTKQADGVFSWLGNLTGNDKGFKFLNAKNVPAKTINPAHSDIAFEIGTEYSLNYRPAEADPGDYQFKVTYDGRYFVTADLTAMKMFVETIDLSHLYLVGGATSAGWNPSNPVEMTEVSSGIFTWTGTLSADGDRQFKFLSQSGSWNKTFNPFADTEFTPGEEYDLNYRPREASPNDRKFLVATSGEYTVNVDLNTMKVNIALPTGIAPAKINALPYKLKVWNKTVSIETAGDNVIQSAAIYDVTGKCLHFISNPESSIVLGENLAGGVYIIRVQVEEKAFVQKTVIK
jgi:hypothetical protein